MSSTVSITLTTDQLEVLKAVLSQAVKPGKAVKARRSKADGPKEKKETPSQVGPWNAYVSVVHEELKKLPVDEVWDMYAAANPMSKAKKGEESVPLATDEARESFKVIRKVAMVIASHRKKNGLMPAEYVHVPLTDDEKKARKAAAAASVAGSASESEAAPAPAKVKKPRAKAVVAVAPVVVAPVVAAAPEASADEADDGFELSEFKHGGRQYLKTSAGHCWQKNSDGSRGKWAGLYNEETKRIDTSAPEPEVDEE